MTLVAYVTSSAVLMAMIIALIPGVIRKDEFSFKLFLICVLFQNILGILFSPYCKSLYIQVLILYKELVLYGVIVMYCITHFKTKIKVKNIYMFIYMILLIIFTLVSSASLYARLVSLRQLLQPLVLVYFGYCLSVSGEDIEKFEKLVIKIGVILAVFGFIEEFILGDKFWLTLKISKYYIVRGFGSGIFSHGLPGDYYSADFYSLTGRSFRRMVSFLADPLLSAHFMAFSFVLLLYGKNLQQNKLKRQMQLIILVIAILLTLSKGAILIVGISIYFYIRNKYKVFSYFVFLICLGLVVVIIKKDVFDSMQFHINGLTSSVRLLGTGLGTAGNFAAYAGEKTTGAGESYLGAIMAQVGGVALCLFLASFVKIFKVIQKNNNTIMAKAIVAYIIASLVESSISESAISYVGNGISFVFIGMMYRQAVDNIETKRK